MLCSVHWLFKHWGWVHAVQDFWLSRCLFLKKETTEAVSEPGAFHAYTQDNNKLLLCMALYSTTTAPQSSIQEMLCLQTLFQFKTKILLGRLRIIELKRWKSLIIVCCLFAEHAKVEYFHIKQKSEFLTSQLEALIINSEATVSISKT